ncbi:GTPase, G3E family [Butyrivibrio sp. ob235]|uniref:GTP-binding protein n=1 Tax=Butyrivibrio sp. ob235 TaxID=1761780 RepID=UPI0008ABC5DF|nr:GTP-binding protein [Butyrivibrio sp. ob235]SEL55137.1 GTPase, G3E family [Butyrivibrio sp. ob235]
MTKIDIISGFLGAGKTTLIKKLLKEALAGTKTVLIENEFGEIGIDGGFLKESGIDIREMNSGCICCSLVGDFGTSLKEVMDTYAPERILIEPSGVGKLSDVMRAIQNVADESENLTMNSAVTVVDVSKAKIYIKNFGEFFTNQIENAGTILLTRTDKADAAKIEKAVELIREHNPKATIITTPLAELSGKEVLDTFEGNHDLEAELLKEVLAKKADEHHHHHDHGSEKFTDEEGVTVYRAHKHDHDHEDEHDHEHDHDHEHHHHDHDEHDHEHEHHHHDHDEHDHDHHHDADDIFTSWGMETPAKYNKAEIEAMLGRLEEEETFGVVLRAKGMVPDENGGWIEFDYVPGEPVVRDGAADVTGKFCVIGAELNQDNLEKLFRKKL